MSHRKLFESKLEIDLLLLEQQSSRSDQFI